MATNPLAPNPETDIDGPDVRQPLEPDTGVREFPVGRNLPIPDDKKHENLGERVPLEEDYDV
jgi:hypothetical protein